MKISTYAALFCSSIIIYVLAACYPASAMLVKISRDPFHNPAAAHATEVESDNFAYGQTMVGVFQVGRYQDSNAGSTDIGWSSTTDNGVTWTYGYLPGITREVFGAAPYQRVTDPAVAYDAKHGIWMIVSLPRGTSHGQTTYLVPIISRSADALNWQQPVHIAPDSGDFMDKPWIVCDNWTSSPYFGNCYVEYIDVNLGEVLLMSTSRDGGLTWSTPSPSADYATGNGGQPIVQPNGTVVEPFLGFGIESVSSTDGGMTWNASVFVANANEQPLPGGLRDPGPLPSAEVDGSGTVYVAWQDCSFRLNCATNDIVYSTTIDGQHWSAVTRVPIDPTTSTLDHFLPGMGVDRSTSGANAHLGVTFYYLANANCSFSDCQVYAGFIGSRNGGSTWNRPVKLAGPMQIGWLPNSDLGHMIGDYSATSFLTGVARSSFPVAAQPIGTRFRQAIFTANGLRVDLGGPQLSARYDVRYLSWPVRQRQIVIVI